MKNNVKIIMCALLFSSLVSGFTTGILTNPLSTEVADAYYERDYPGRVESYAPETTMGTGTIRGRKVSYYTALPAGSCIETVSMGVTYYNCNGDYYRPYYAGNQLVYVKESP